MKLFPYHPPPAPVRGWHVPVPKMKLAEIVDPTWDLTLQKIVPHIDGVNDVRRIAWLADVSLPLTQTALQHLLYYDTILMLDMFFFGSCYAPRPGIHDFIANRDGLVDECAGYVSIGGSLPAPLPSAASARARSDGHEAGGGGSHARGASTTTAGSDNVGEGHTAANTTATLPERVSNYQLIKLMTTFCVGRSIMEWIKLHQDAGFGVLSHVDVRRFVQFGVIKGLLYRVHKYVVSKQYLALLATGQARPLREDEGLRSQHVAGGGDEGSTMMMGDPLQRYTDGCHSFDQIITEQNMADGEIMEKLRGFQAPPGDLTVYYR